jgi:hypothetical protein
MGVEELQDSKQLQKFFLPVSLFTIQQGFSFDIWDLCTMSLVPSLEES